MSQKSITIQGLEFPVATPYSAGHVVTEAEAKALNQVRLENIRNNTAAAIAKLKDEKGVKDAEGKFVELPAEAMAEATALVAEYDAGYVFTLASVGSGKRVTDPIEAEAKKLAKAAIKAKLAGEGRSLNSVDSEKLAAAIAKVAESEAIQKEARRIVKARAESAKGALESLDI